MASGFDMNQTNQPLLASLAITITSIVVVVFSFRILQSEEEARHLVLGVVPSNPTNYTITNSGAPSECLGTINFSLDSSDNQAHLTLNGWMRVSLAGRTETLELKAQLVFNALGQLSASLLETVLKGESLRFGTLGVNPIKAQIFRGSGESRPLFEQTLPGPIELRPRANTYEIVAPQLPGLRTLSAPSTVPLSLQSAPTTSCSRETAKAFDLTPFLRMAEALTERLRGVLPSL